MGIHFCQSGVNRTSSPGVNPGGAVPITSSLAMADSMNRDYSEHAPGHSQRRARPDLLCR